ncbi:MAG: ABC transporter permease [candidate division WOR-3 bacterium]|jgi:ABC-type transport system involved in multi-copper enzyme maturation permease subunit
MFNRIAGIAVNTFRESVRDRVLAALIIIAIVVMASAKVIQPVALGEAEKIVKDLGLSAITLFCVLIAILVGGRIVYREVEKRTIYLLLSRPVRRTEFIIGKYLGMMLVLGVSLLILTAGFYLVLVLTGVKPDSRLLLAVVMTGFELAILTAVAVLFSTFVTPIASAVFTFLIYFIGHSTHLLKQLAAMSPVVAVKFIGLFLYYLLPNLNNFNLRGDVVHGAPLNPLAIVISIAYALVYTFTLLFIAVVIFNRRDF